MNLCLCAANAMFKSRKFHRNFGTASGFNVFFFILVTHSTVGSQILFVCNTPCNSFDYKNENTMKRVFIYK